MSEFDKFEFIAPISQALANKGYTKPTPIQEQSIAHIMKGGDILGIAQTGTGKTAAFSLPIIHNIAKNKKKIKPARMRCLIMTPTRELASQIEENIKAYSKGLALKSCVIFGGVGQRAQIQNLVKGQDIIIATPGRLLDHMNEGRVLFDQLDVFILDEADRMLDMGFIRDIKKIIAKLPEKRQTLLFSATMPKDIADLSQKLLKNPKRVEVTPESTTVEKIDQKINLVEKGNKPLLLINILKDKKIKNMIVFTRTKHGADRVVKHLDRVGIASAAIHGNKSQGARERALGGFKKGALRVLVATDIAARGIDVPGISHVINYDLPDDPKNYVHRIGRTARAGKKGIAISFCDPAEKALYKQIEKSIKAKIPIDEDHAFHGVPADHSKNGARNKMMGKTGGQKKGQNPRRRTRRPKNNTSRNKTNPSRSS
ncbi:MAG: DEAD/DEAH box helicase [Halobacteriovoraceae bacterium]|nr:DEAD/DEAH box helicase [Halobacteriovoraceae bacterium]|tara:strand:+ start:72689 stop:73972 length:1284 start_codon:yes stop_codon:yes gene_type:complete